MTDGRAGLDGLPCLGLLAPHGELATILRRAGARVVATAGALEELERDGRWRAAVVDLDALCPRGRERLARRDRLQGRGLLAVGSRSAEALLAFEAGAAAYLARPFDAPDLERALARLARWHAAHRRAPLLAEIGRRSGERQRRERAPRRLLVRRRGRLLPISLDDVVWVRARHNEVEIDCGGERVRFRSTLGALADRLAPFGFVRVHRSLIVRADAIRGIRASRHDRPELLLGGGDRLSLSPGQVRELERACGAPASSRTRRDAEPRDEAGRGAPASEGRVASPRSTGSRHLLEAGTSPEAQPSGAPAAGSPSSPAASRSQVATESS